MVVSSIERIEKNSYVSSGFDVYKKVDPINLILQILNGKINIKILKSRLQNLKVKI